MRTDGIIVLHSTYWAYYMLGTKCFIHVTSLILTTPPYMLDATILIPHLRKRNQNKIKQFTQGLIAKRHCHHMITSRFLKENVFQVPILDHKPLLPWQ